MTHHSNHFTAFPLNKKCPFDSAVFDTNIICEELKKKSVFHYHSGKVKRSEGGELHSWVISALLRVLASVHHKSGCFRGQRWGTHPPAVFLGKRGETCGNLALEKATRTGNGPSNCFNVLLIFTHIKYYNIYTAWPWLWYGRAHFLVPLYAFCKEWD